MKSVNVPPMSTPTTRMNHLTSFPEQLTEGARENAHTELDVFRGAVFVARMADAAPARNEDHRGGGGPPPPRRGGKPPPPAAGAGRGGGPGRPPHPGGPGGNFLPAPPPPPSP